MEADVWEYFLLFPPCRPEKRCNPERGADVYPNLLQLSSLDHAVTNSRHQQKVWIEMQAMWSLFSVKRHVDTYLHSVL